MKKSIPLSFSILFLGVLFLSAAEPGEDILDLLQGIRLQAIRFERASLEDVVPFLLQSFNRGTDQEQKDVQFQVQDAGNREPVTLQARNVTYWQAIGLLAEISGSKVALEGHTVRFVPGDAKPEGVLFRNLPPEHPVRKQCEEHVLPSVRPQEARASDVIHFARSHSRVRGGAREDHPAHRLVYLVQNEANLPRVTMDRKAISFWDFLLRFETKTETTIHLENEHLVIRKAGINSSEEAEGARP